MLQIEQTNLLLEKTVNERVHHPQGEPLRLVDRIVSDFDFCTFHVSTAPEAKTTLIISLYVKCWDDLARYGAKLYLDGKYGRYPEVTVAPAPEQGYNYTLAVDTGALGAHADAAYVAEVVGDIALLKRHAMAAPFEQAFARYDALAREYGNVDTYAEDVKAQLADEPVLVIKYRGHDEGIYIKPLFDRVTVIFSTVFQDETDKIFGKVFLQEFVDARKRRVQNAPQVLYSHRDAPLDIAALVPAAHNDNKGYVTLVLFPRHLLPHKREYCITHVQVFRDYFHYHIKCFKAYMHSRMRTRVKDFLKVLNRAKPDADDDDKTRKTATGRRFEQRV